MSKTLPNSLSATPIAELHAALLRSQQFLISLDEIISLAAEMADSHDARLVRILYHQRIGLNQSVLDKFALETIT